MSESGWGGAYRVSPVYHCIFTGIFIQQNTIEWYQFLPDYQIHLLPKGLIDSYCKKLNVVTLFLACNIVIEN